jgi:DNA-binding transcriptional MerR regulator
MTQSPRSNSASRKSGYKIGEACRLLDIQPYVLRYWETEFPALQPPKSLSGQRLYTDHELDLIRRIKQLLYEEGYTIAGAKKKLDADLASGGPTRGLFDDPASEAGAATPPAATALDTLPDERIETLRSGIAETLADARELLHLLGGEPPAD